MLKTALAAICVLVVLAVGYLTLSVIVLRPPRVHYAAWYATASVIVVSSAVTLAAVSGVGRRAGAAFAGGATLALLGGWMIRQTVTSSHFEGYALLLGAMLAVQGTLTVVVFAIRPSTV
ncbi:MAG TPA: hypothetical protein VKH42_08670 [Vicinamibacterales bacterium]|nr:hypothetical protein [Vicinamibacterales bacterium]